MNDDNKTKKQLVHEIAELRSQIAGLEKSESAEKYRSLVENVRDVIYELDSQGVVLYISPAIRDLLGYDSAEIVGKSFIKLGHKEDQSSLTEWFSELRKGVEKPSEYRIINKSGEIRWTRSSTRPIMEDGLFKGARGILIDVTEQRRVVEALRESEEKYRLVVDNMADVVTIRDMNLRFTYVSPSIMRLRGYTVEEAMAQTLEQVMTPKSMQIIAKVFEEEMKLEASGTADPDRSRIVELEEYRKDGSIVWIENHLSFMRDETQKPVSIISLSRDITERKHMEEALKESDEQWRDLFNRSRNAILIYEATDEGQDFIIRNCNPVVESIESVKRDEIVGRRVTEVFPGVEAFGLLAVFRRVWKTAVSEMHDVSLYKDERISGWRENFVYKLHTGEIVAMYDDVTPRKQAEEALKQTNLFLDSIIENIPNMLFLKDAGDLRFIRFNRAGEDLLGYSRDDLLGKSDYDFFPKEQADFFTQKDRDVLRGKAVVDIPEETLQTRNRGEVTIHTKKVPLLDSKGEPEFLLGISEDITERKQAEKALKETIESLRKAVSTTIQVMVSAVEIRDPYTAGHQIRSADLARSIASEMGLSQEKIDGIRMAGSIHDIGKLSIPAEILSKPAKLTDLEFSLIKEHSRIGYALLKDVESSWPLAEIVLQHHERMNGSGYPGNLKGNEILMEARIMAVADVVESMGTHRPYRPALGMEAALDEITKNRDILYDPEVVDACLRLFKEKGFQLK